MHKEALKKPFRICTICVHGYGTSANRAECIAEALTGKRTSFGVGQPADRVFHTPEKIPIRVSCRGLKGFLGKRRIRLDELKDVDFMFASIGTTDHELLRAYGRGDLVEEISRLDGEGKIHEGGDKSLDEPKNLKAFILKRMQSS